MRSLWAGSLRLLGVVLGLLSCIPMLSMLPAGFAAGMALLGLAAPPIVAWVAPIASLTPLLWIFSIAFLVLGDLRCGWPPASLAAVGGLMIYLAMYVFVAPPTIGAMAGMQGTISAEAPPAVTAGFTNAPMFYIGLALIVGSFGLVMWRRKWKTCQPFKLPFLLRIAK